MVESEANDVRVTSDGGFIVAGYTRSFGALGKDVWILKLNSDGEISWQKIYGGAQDDYATGIRQTSDGGYVVSADTDSYGFGSGDIWALRLSSDGVIEWQTAFGGTSTEDSSSVHLKPDGGYFVVGSTTAFGPCGRNFWVLSLPPDGQLPGAEFQTETTATTQDTDAVPDDTHLSVSDSVLEADAIFFSITDTDATVTVQYPE